MAETTSAQVPLLQKMEIADILDTAIRLYRHNFTLFLEIAVVAQGFLLLLYVWAAWLIVEVILAPAGSPPPWDTLAGIIVLGILVLLVGSLLYPLGEAALAIAVSETHLGRNITLWQAYRRAWPLWWRLFLTMIIISILIQVGAQFFYIPGILCWVWFSLATPIVALEENWGPSAMGRSYNLIRGRGWRVFATLLLLHLLVQVASAALSVIPIAAILLITLPTNPALAIPLIAATAIATGIVVRPVSMTGIVLIYYDLRIRKEGFDLVTLTQALERSRGEGAGEEKPAAFQPSERELPPAPDTRVGLPPRPDQSESEQQPPTQD